ncbi:hypothetical protein L596_020675 [Steinernema carpocapsae]|uniref:Uncharacterized protein n=1 Tax=Steinernema carpocapsae TaxID=34508 RepID=A0A4U5MUF6_STECR|nr:hypothetical protein L596_020675 [Steinernema carpocapsae]
MGVTMARPIIKGLKVKILMIYTFIGIAGGNYGLCLCASAATETWEGCNTVNGFAPGTCRSANATCTVDPENCQVNNYASLLDKANKNLIREGRKTYAIWSTKDEIITNKNLVFGRYTSSFPTMDNHIEFHDYNHMDTKDKTVQQQYEWVQH